MTQAHALWITAAQQAECREIDVSTQADMVEIETLYTGISRGTERLVYHGQVPPAEHDTMRAPFQEGDFTFPVKYGYSAVGRVQNGPRKDQLVFSLFPHQTRFAVPDNMALTIPTDVPAKRAILAANMETALNITWDAGLRIGDRVAVIGCGVVGALVGYLAGQMPGTEVTLIDIDPTRESLARTLGCDFATPQNAQKVLGGDADVIVHASANSAGLSLGLDLAGIEAKVIEASWYGAAMTETPLGGRFHQRRLQLVSSQVGRVPAAQAARWDYGRRLAKALALLRDGRLDALISGETAFGDLARRYGDILHDPATLCHRVRYGG
ncbi:zinc-binding alcohol dehydrogenase [Yoonia sp. BS5-3]|uniref:Zinc-binding alcohol dehydrogenase n=1 Tax=Yoonia phaeophyticola TaxID=3137369 RepID=A0ABZ2V5M0_9RHOB